MSSTIYKAPSERELIEIIEAEGIENISGKPTCHTLLKLVNQLAVGCRAIECEYSNYGLSYLVLPQALYQILICENIVAPTAGSLPNPHLRKHRCTRTISSGAAIQPKWHTNREQHHPYSLAEKQRVKRPNGQGTDCTYQEQI
jgi:hypothetical protein